MNNEGVSISYETLRRWAVSCFEKAGAKSEQANVMAESLIQADLLGFSTHGLRRLPYNVKRLVKIEADSNAEVEIVKRRAAVETWDAHTLPGIYIAPLAVKRACEMAKEAGTGTIVVRKADHVACLASYLEQATSQGLVVSMIASTPAQASVAPFGGKSRVFSPNPYALGVPTSSVPLWVDMSFSITAAGKVNQANDRGELLPFQALVDAYGEVSNRPETYLKEGGALMPIGGAEHGYKGYALCLMSEIWTMALSNYGRMDGVSDGERNSLFVQVMDPSAFGELAQFKRVTDDLLQRCRDSLPIVEREPVRIPGERAYALRKKQLQEGVKLDSIIWSKLVSCSERLGIQPPSV
ncbi:MULTISPECIES: Ldh family oxidoreductase [Gammaproteobacteria]|uniref:Ldh family oxidoreductase n=1 Tax=Gammaproteobacteria TaxID=1236 RepID=UPI000DCFAE50|nr:MULTISPECIES: Ldh family oxidoreductase [Gammaproteobacteria]RTE85469.1 Ldh family oxidoreductase [Aliidiomarina sp. B3213]TCZ89436.1 Ldh family oxidoreductase [Lysobacter sp. N42]